MPLTATTAPIFVQIPAYRDRELLPTLRDLMDTAANPDRLRVAIAWQYGPEEEPLEPAILEWENVDLHKIPADRSEGCNWARNLLQRHWDGEPYTLFLDSHHRFVPRWDERIIQLYDQCRALGTAKPILTGYLPPYDPRRDPEGRTTAIFRICALERHRGLLFRLTGHAITLGSALESPVPAHFVSLHFLFTDGTFNRAIPFDPSVYFFADEVAIALRAYTFGYQLFHPHQLLGWHLYDRSTRRTHWSDHPTWAVRAETSCRRLRKLYSGSLTGRYGIGSERSVSEYEELIGMQLISDEDNTLAGRRHEAAARPAPADHGPVRPEDRPQ